MNMTPELWIAILNFSTKFGIDAAIAITNAVSKPGATIDDAINALKDIQSKSAEDYLKEAGGPAPVPVETSAAPQEPAKP